jgi:hypothetical protein
MQQPMKYPLEEMISIKQSRFDQAVKILEQKKLLLEQAYEKLFEVTEERDLVLQHKVDKLTQLREALDEGTTTDKVQQMKAYLKVVDVRLAEKEKKVVEQQRQVDLAQKQVDVATDELFQKKKDLEKLQLHKKEWEKEMRVVMAQKETLEHDEQGSATHHIQKKEAVRRKKSDEKK